MVSYRSLVGRLRRESASNPPSVVARVHSPWTQLGLAVWAAEHLTPNDSGHVIIMPLSPAAPGRVDQRLAHVLTGFPNVKTWVVDPIQPGSRGKTTVRRLLAGPSYFASKALQVRVVSGRFPDIAGAIDLGLPRATVKYEVLDEGFGGAPAKGWDSLGLRTANVVRRIAVPPKHVRHHLLIDAESGQVDRALATRYRQFLCPNDAPRLPREPGSRIAILATSYLSEFGRTTRQAEVDACSKALELLTRAGFQVLIKPHPREQPGKYDQAAKGLGRFLDSQVPGEAYLPSLNEGDVVVGHLSNLLFTAQVLFDLPVYLLPGAAFGVPRNTAIEVAYARQFPAGLPSIERLSVMPKPDQHLQAP